MKSSIIRKKFISFFEKKNHKIVSSSNITVKNDPTLMFTNSGMNQFKDIFLGINKIIHKRVVNSQKCLRVSGKHNDLDEVGHDNYHHTMFEMLGNWSFGDYFKKEAINWAWEFLVDELKLDVSRIYVTIFEGDKKINVKRDNESAKIWKNYISSDKIILGNKNDNFWEMGEVGPCGPCSEIHYDLRNNIERTKVKGKDLVNKDHPEVIEIWNLVFIQYHKKSSGKLSLLSEFHIDTGMGFERLAMVMQKKNSSYDTDIFVPIIDKISSLVKIEYGLDENVDVAFRVISDHLRAVCFTIADGLLLSNNGPGYVIRRILRRAIRYYYTYFKVEIPIIYNLVDVIDEQYLNIYPEINKNKEYIKKIIFQEETNFLGTIKKGLKKIDELVDKSKKKFSGSSAFELYDTYGFPIDLTRIILNEKGLQVDMKQFDIEMGKQKDRARNASNYKVKDWNIILNSNSKFIGYDFSSARVRILRFREITLKGNKLFQIVLDNTPFYPEGGGQVGDTGRLVFENDIVEIIDTKKENDLIVHYCKNLPKNLNVKFLAEVNLQRRKYIKSNHSATHLLHFALRDYFGKHIEQKGSLVNEKYLRFDFSHHSKLSLLDIEKIEKIINKLINDNVELEEIRNLPIDQAKKINALMLFGEKYKNQVRVIKFGNSVELCGGLHVKNTSIIRLFKIISETSISSGIRRIEAITSDQVINHFKSLEEDLRNIKKVLGNTINPIKAIDTLIKERNLFSSKLNQHNLKYTQKIKKELINNIIIHNKNKIIISKLDLSPKEIKNITFEISKTIDNVIIIIGSEFSSKSYISAYISKKIIQKFNLSATEIINKLSHFIDGRGGGQNFYASAGGNKLDGINKALSEARKILLTN